MQIAGLFLCAAHHWMSPTAIPFFVSFEFFVVPARSQHCDRIEYEYRFAEYMDGYGKRVAYATTLSAAGAFIATIVMPFSRARSSVVSRSTRIVLSASMTIATPPAAWT